MVNRPLNKDVISLNVNFYFYIDNIAHESIQKEIGTFPRGKLIKEWLKAGFIDKGKLNQTETGTPQGGVSALRSVLW